MKIKKFLNDHMSLLWALGLLLAVALLAMNRAFFKIRPVVLAETAYKRNLMIFVFLMVFLLIGAGVLAAFFSKKKDFFQKNKHIIAAATVSVFGFIYIFVMPPFSAPDEIRHYLGAYRLSNQMMFKAEVDSEGYVYMRQEDAEPLLNDFPGRDDYYKLLSKSSWIGNADSETVLYTGEKYQEGFALSYLPQALGITLGRLLGLKQLPMLVLGRLFSLAVFVIFLILTLKIIPFGGEIIMVISCLPMVLEEVSAFSYDGIVLSLSMYFIAYVLRLAFLESRVRVADMVVLTLVMSFLAPVKVIYVMLALFMFMIPAEKFGGIKKYLINAVAMVLAVGLVFFLSRAGKLAEYVQETNTGLSYAEQGSYTISYVLSHPLWTVRILINTFEIYSGSLFTDMVGGRLGWQDIAIPGFAAIGFILLLGTAAIKPAEEPVYLKGKHRFNCWAVFGLVAFFAVFAMMLAATPLGYEMVVGVQGRYFLPVLPLALLAVRSDKLRRSENTACWIVYGSILLNIWVVADIVAAVMERMGVTKMLSAT